MSTIAPPAAATALAATAPVQAPAPVPANADRAKLAAVSKKFEAIFVRQMLAEARKSSFGDELFGSQATDTFRQMQDDHFADISAQRGVFGLAQTIEQQLAQRLLPTAKQER